MSQVSINSPAITKAGKIIQQVRATTSNLVTASTAIPLDNTIPQQTEGDEVLTVTITPIRADSILLIEYYAFAVCNASGSNNYFNAAIFRDATLNAVAGQRIGGAQPWDDATTISIIAIDSSAAIAATTYKTRLGPILGGRFIDVNGLAPNTDYGGAQISYMTVTEIAP